MRNACCVLFWDAMDSLSVAGCMKVWGRAGNHVKLAESGYT